jgi:hypothetical protein
MMQWTPFGTTEADLKEHIRTFASVFEHVTAIRGPGGYGFYMLGSAEPIDLDATVAREVLARPGVLDDISSAFDSPASTVDDWIAVIDDHRWIADDALRTYAGEGPLITDDEPRPEYFLLRGLADILRR